LRGEARRISRGVRAVGQLAQPLLVNDAEAVGVEQKLLKPLSSLLTHTLLAQEQARAKSTGEGGEEYHGHDDDRRRAMPSAIGATGSGMVGWGHGRSIL